MTPDTSTLVLAVVASGAGCALVAALVVRGATRARELAALRGEHATLRAAHEAAQRRAIALEAELAAATRTADEQRRFLDAAEQRMRESFEAASGAVLQRNSEYVASRAKEVLAGEQRRVDEALRPVGASVEALRTLVAELEQRRATVDGRLQQELATLARAHGALHVETQKLAGALANPRTRGSWGELQLRRVVEVAGMQDHVDFSTQVTTTGTTAATTDAVQRPDMIVHLAGGKSLVVDAKVPLGAYLEAMDATDEVAREASLRRHAQQVRTHVRQLASKAYWNALPGAPDFVVLFLPGEAFLHAALLHDPALFDEAFASNVLLASPVNLVALLKSAAYGWQQERLARNAEEIQAEATTLLRRVGVLAEHFADVGKGVRAAAEAYNRAVRSYDRHILPRVRALGTLGATVDERTEAPAPVETAALDTLLPAASDDAIGRPVPTLLLQPEASPDAR
jgi:DNA recombination protein RmuC